MKNQFQYNDPQKAAPIRIEQVWAEKPGGGLLMDAGFEVPETTAVGLDESGKYKAIKSAKVITKYNNGTGTTIEVAKGHGFQKGEFIAFGGMAKTISSITTSDPNKDTITINAVMTSVTINVGEHMYQAKAAVDTDAVPIVAPIYIVSDGHPTASNGIVAYPGNGDTPVRLINGANVRKETCNFGADIEKLLPGIHRV